MKVEAEVTLDGQINCPWCGAVVDVELTGPVLVEVDVSELQKVNDWAKGIKGTQYKPAGEVKGG